MNPSDFIKMVAPAAVDFNKQHRIPASLFIAQGALESDWGDAAPGNNLFGIKWQPGCGFDYVEAKTQEYINGKWQTVVAKFRRYKSFADSIRDHGNFLLQSRYHNLQGADYRTACDLIYKDGYATDPQYSKSLLAIIEQYHLYQYDVKAGDKMLLEIGSKGDLVKQVQHAINKLGYTPALVEDGIFGRDTYQAVQWAQRLKGIPADGIVGPQTLQALGLSEQPAPQPKPAPQPTPKPQPAPQPAPQPTPSADVHNKVLAVWNIDVVDNGFFFDLPVQVADPNVKSIGKMQLDTGAFEILLDKGIADAIGLPNQGTQQFVGVDGKPQDGYNSTLPVKVGDKVINMPCVVDPFWNAMSGSIGLFGMKGLIDNHIGLDVDPDAGTVTLYDSTGDKKGA